MKNRFEIRDNITAIFLDRLDGTSIETIISTEDLDKAKEHPCKWYAAWSKDRMTFYVHGYVKRGKIKTTSCLHRVITNCPQGLEVDHMNHDTLDNTRENIRIVTKSINQQNVRLRSDNSSGYRGVIWEKQTNKWKTIITVNNKKIYLGSFSCKEEAGEVARKARAKLMSGYIMDKECVVN